MRQSKRFTITGYRLVALWAFAEAGLGGVLHALHLPVTGLLVGGFAVICMSLLAAYEKPDAILPALGIVLTIKFLASPHSPPPAYVAVTFQGLVAWMLFRFLPNFKVAAILLGALSLLESALQKLLMLVLFFGMPLYEAAGTFITYVSESLNFDIASDGEQLILVVVAVYLTFHLAAGLFIGSQAAVMPVKLLEYQVVEIPTEGKTDPKKRKRHIIKWAGKIIILAIPVLIIYFYYNPGTTYPLLKIFARFFLVLLLTGPLLQIFIGLFIKNRAHRYSLEVSGILESLPYMRKLLFACWKRANAPGWRRMPEFLQLFIASWLFRSQSAMEGYTSSEPVSNN
ncbi:MAG: hypothetical protein WBB45_13840 [Cyclobacteriaceae bacterium]